MMNKLLEAITLDYRAVRVIDIIIVARDVNLSSLPSDYD